MSLLWMDYETEFQNLVEKAHQCECEDNQEYFSGLSRKVHKIIYRDTKYNVDFLYTAYVLQDDKIIENYAVWLFELMASVLKYKTLSEVVVYVVNHLEYIKQGVYQTVSEDKRDELIRLLELAQACIREKVATDAHAKERHGVEPKFCKSPYEEEVEQYMDSLFKNDMRESVQLVQAYLEKGIPVASIYIDILAESMRRVGELWHTAKISVATEHYCTSVTQMVMAQLYPIIFAVERKNKKVICACPGTELHEMGARMVADLFENNGWESIFLGAAVPEDAMLKSIRENQPDLVALSVTMPQHLMICHELVEAIKAEFPNVKIAVGGGAFRCTEDIWKRWPVDIYTDDARELLEKANEI